MSNSHFTFTGTPPVHGATLPPLPTFGQLPPPETPPPPRAQSQPNPLPPVRTPHRAQSQPNPLPPVRTPHRAASLTSTAASTAEDGDLSSRFDALSVAAHPPPPYEPPHNSEEYEEPYECEQCGWTSHKYSTVHDPDSDGDICNHYGDVLAVLHGDRLLCKWCLQGDHPEAEDYEEPNECEQCGWTSHKYSTISDDASDRLLCNRCLPKDHPEACTLDQWDGGADEAVAKLQMEVARGTVELVHLYLEQAEAEPDADVHVEEEYEEDEDFDLDSSDDEEVTPQDLLDAWRTLLKNPTAAAVALRGNPFNKDMYEYLQPVVANVTAAAASAPKTKRRKVVPRSMTSEAKARQLYDLMIGVGHKWAAGDTLVLPTQALPALVLTPTTTVGDCTAAYKQLDAQEDGARLMLNLIAFDKGRILDHALLHYLPEDYDAFREALGVGIMKANNLRAYHLTALVYPTLLGVVAVSLPATLSLMAKVKKVIRNSSPAALARLQTPMPDVQGSDGRIMFECFDMKSPSWLAAQQPDYRANVHELDGFALNPLCDAGREAYLPVGADINMEILANEADALGA